MEVYCEDEDLCNVDCDESCFFVEVVKECGVEIDDESVSVEIDDELNCVVTCFDTLCVERDDKKVDFELNKETVSVGIEEVVEINVDLFKVDGILEEEDAVLSVVEEDGSVVADCVEFVVEEDIVIF